MLRPGIWNVGSSAEVALRKSPPLALKHTSAYPLLGQSSGAAAEVPLV